MFSFFIEQHMFFAELLNQGQDQFFQGTVLCHEIRFCGNFVQIGVPAEYRIPIVFHENTRRHFGLNCRQYPAMPRLALWLCTEVAIRKEHMFLRNQ
jgi:hypothetical protein